MIKMFSSFYRSYATFMKKKYKNENINIKDYKFNTEYDINQCRCKYNINYTKHILYIIDKNKNKKISNVNYNNQLEQWYFTTNHL